MTKYNWPLIEREYVRGYKDENNIHIHQPTLKQIAERHGCNYGNLRNKVAPAGENWKQKRDIYTTKIQQQIFDKEIEIISDELVELDNSTLNAAKEAIDLIVLRIKDETITNHDIQKLGSALLDFQKAYKNVFGEPTEHIKKEETTPHKPLFDVEIQRQILEAEEGYNFLKGGGDE